MAGVETRRLGEHEVRIVNGHAELPEGMRSVPKRAFLDWDGLFRIRSSSLLGFYGNTEFVADSAIIGDPDNPVTPVAVIEAPSVRPANHFFKWKNDFLHQNSFFSNRWWACAMIRPSIRR